MAQRKGIQGPASPRALFLAQENSTEESNNQHDKCLPGKGVSFTGRLHELRAKVPI